MARLGAYEVEAELGRGGFARVLRGRHVETGALHALKVLDGALSAEDAARFRREAEALARVAAADVVGVHDVFVERGRMVLVMDLMPGGALRARMGAPWPWQEAAALVAGLARTLERCHAAGLVHRDVKPENVLFDAQGRARLADFGCARDLAAATLTETGAALGTPAYMAPEQLDGQRVDGRADAWALGVVLHELLTGARPFARDGPYALLAALARGARPRPPRTGAPAAIDAALRQALELDPARRVDAATLACALEAALAAAPRGRGSRAAVALASALLLAGVALALAGGLALVDGGAAPGSRPPPADGSPAPVTPAPGAEPVTERRPEPPLRPEPRPAPAARGRRAPEGLDDLLPARSLPGGAALPDPRSWFDVERVMKTAKELRLAEPATSAGLLCWVTAHADEPLFVMRAWHQLGLLFEEGRRLDAARACFEEGARRGSRLCLIWQAQAALAAAPPRAEEAAALLRWAVDAGFGDDVDHDEARLALARLGWTRPDLVSEDEVLHHLLMPLRPRAAQGRVLRAHLTLEREGRAAEAEAVYLEEAQTVGAPAEASVRLALLRGEVPPASPPHRWAQVLFAEQLFLEAEGAMRASAVDLLRSLVGHDDDTGRRAALTLAVRCHLDEEAAGRPAPVSRAEALDVLRRLAAVEPADDWVLRARRIVSGG